MGSGQISNLRLASKRDKAEIDPESISFVVTSGELSETAGGRNTASSPKGNWRPTREEAAGLREYLLRGGFLLVDDFHGEYAWSIFESAMKQVMPDRPIIEIPEDDPLMHIFYDLDERNPIPGLRHLRRGPGGQIVARMEGQPHWRGIYDDHGRLIVAINFNIDMGDSWEHADDPYYPVPMTALGYKFGVNYVIYAMTH